MSITSIRIADDVEKPLEALESIKAGKSIGEEDVNAWLNSWGTNNRKSPPKS
ncbi:MAG TPA: CopG family transcriptional regulator [Gammaproteobacteria bacterium]